uniref:Uncharacterized protein n=1 Tax=Ananas comosus var. bracteatus TaxID=296719 RepID=A0A6V7NF35_ANACO|nr:unnamed protein product [Ananas comosus var. bracteatus]
MPLRLVEVIMAWCPRLREEVGESIAWCESLRGDRGRVLKPKLLLVAAAAVAAAYCWLPLLVADLPLLSTAATTSFHCFLWLGREKRWERERERVAERERGERGCR